MSTPYIYLDHGATTPIDPAVAEAMAPYFYENNFGNPLSIHRAGKQASRALEAARATVAKYLNASPDEIIFTSGGTESNNMAILGVTATIATQTTNRHIITSAIEHSSVEKPFAYLEAQGWHVTYLSVDKEGFVSFETLKAAIRPDTVFVSIMHANNEMGAIQPIAEIGAYLRAQNIPFHTDSVQTAGKLPLDTALLNVDYLAMSAHKFYGPKGAGVFYVRRGALRPTPLLFGGGQESQYRSGTHNVPAYVGLAKAFELANEHLKEEAERLNHLQRHLIDRILAEVPNAELNGPADTNKRVPGNVNFSFPPAEGEGLVLQLDLKGIGVSTGSACNSATVAPSKIALAMGKAEAVAQATVRFSMGHQTTQEQIDTVVETLKSIMARYQKKNEALTEAV